MMFTVQFAVLRLPAASVAVRTTVAVGASEQSRTVSGLVSITSQLSVLLPPAKESAASVALPIASSVTVGGVVGHTATGASSSTTETRVVSVHPARVYTKAYSPVTVKSTSTSPAVLVVPTVTPIGFSAAAVQVPPAGKPVRMKGAGQIGSSVSQLQLISVTRNEGAPPVVRSAGSFTKCVST